MGSFVAATPSIQDAQISVEVTNMDAQGLSAHHANGGYCAKLPFGLEDLNVDGFVRGELGFTTEFALQNGKLINGNSALGSHPKPIYPSWSSLWSLKTNQPIFDLVAFLYHQEEGNNTSWNSKIMVS